MALIAQAATFRTRIPFLHFFDGFRTSHEIARIELLSDDDIRVDDRYRSASNNIASGGWTRIDRYCGAPAQNPDVFFQAREAINSFYAAAPAIVQADDGSICAANGSPIPVVRLFRGRRCRACPGMMGSGIGAAREAVEPAGRRR